MKDRINFGEFVVDKRGACFLASGLLKAHNDLCMYRTIIATEIPPNTYQHVDQAHIYPRNSQFGAHIQSVSVIAPKLSP